MGELPKAVLERLLRQESGLRISSEAVNEVSSLVELVIRYVGREGGTLAKHAGRNTLMASDVLLAARRAGDELEKYLSERQPKRRLISKL